MLFACIHYYGAKCPSWTMLLMT